MPLYTFLQRDGTQVDRYVTFDDVEAFPVGEWRRHADGVELQRLMPIVQTRAPQLADSMEIHCNQMPRHLPEAPRWDERGACVLRSEAERREFMARTGAVEGGVDEES